MEIDVEKVKKLVLGIDIRIANNLLISLYPSIKTNVQYRESDAKKYSVTGFRFNRVTGEFTFMVASDNLINNLPMIYQENEFLHKFLMVFQHFFNQTDYLLNNIDLYFRPSETPANFLLVLISWFNLDLKLLVGDEKIIRKVLQYAIPLYKIRGTVKGMKLFLYLVTGVMPEIFDASSHVKDFDISKETDIDTTMFSAKKLKNLFYVYFPCYESYFSSDIVDSIHKIVQNEKPSFTMGFVVFKKQRKQARTVSVVAEDKTQVVSDDSIMDF